ncbi:O-methyltransferase [Nocardia sp. NPDC047648]|uniref:O-methyltransferase n=1 Tax=Nocardia sp. NPDC047648 TaxID=3155625 RepID=UPI0033C6129A
MTLNAYVTAVLGPRDPVLDGVLRRSLIEQNMPTIMIDDSSGRVLEMLIRVIRPRRVLEIGTLFGYSTIYLARGLPDGAKVTTVDLNSEVVALARRNFAAAGVDDRIESVVGDAAEYMAEIEDDSIDVIFIDGEKKSYPTYLEHAFRIVRPGGLLIADDAYAAGDYRSESDGDDDAQQRSGIHAYNAAVGRSPCLYSALLGTTNGMMVSVKQLIPR